MKRIFYAVPMLLALVTWAACAPSETQSVVEAEAAPPATSEVATEEALSADEVLRRMSSHFASMDSFRLAAAIEYDDVPVEGIKVEHSGHLEIALARPDRLSVEYRDDQEFKRLWIAEGKATLLDPDQKVYATAPAEADVEATLDSLFDTYGVAVPADDLLAPDPFAKMSANVGERKYLGIHKVRGVPCHHAIFDSGAISWQIWVETGEDAQLCKLVITHTDEPTFPRYSIELESLEPIAPDDATFQVDLPEGALHAPFETVTIEEKS